MCRTLWLGCSCYRNKAGLLTNRHAVDGTVFLKSCSQMGTHRDVKVMKSSQPPVPTPRWYSANEWTNQLQQTHNVLCCSNTPISSPNNVFIYHSFLFFFQQHHLFLPGAPSSDRANTTRDRTEQSATDGRGGRMNNASVSIPPNQEVHGMAVIKVVSGKDGTEGEIRTAESCKRQHQRGREDISVS